MLVHQTQLKCGKIWADMNDKERNVAIIKMAVVMLEEAYRGDKSG